MNEAVVTGVIPDIEPLIVSVVVYIVGVATRVVQSKVVPVSETPAGILTAL